MTKISEEQARSRREAILAAAKHVFARKGCVQATMHDVANEAGLSVGALYLYYPGKDDLMQAVFEQIGESTRGLFNKAAEGASTPAEVLQRTGRILEERFLDPATRDETLLVLEAILSDARDGDVRADGSSGKGRQLRPAYLRLTECLFGRVQETGALDPRIDTEALAQFFVALMVGIHVLSLEFGPDLDVKPVLNVVDEMLLRLGPPVARPCEENEGAVAVLAASTEESE
jgi:AcrR family transcriptional regulator